MKSWSLALLIFFLQAEASVLIPAAEVSETEYRAYLKVHPDDITPSSQILRLRPTKGNHDNLLRLLANAQEAYLSQDRDLAVEKFKELSTLQPIDDWSAEDRSVFLYAYLRLYQLEPRDSSWLTKAANLGADLSTEGDLFPPSLIAQLHDERAKSHDLLLHPAAFKDWPHILINGHDCRMDSCPKVPDSGKNRITWISDRWQPHTQNLTAKDLASYRPPKEPWLNGECGRGVVAFQAKALGETKEFWGLNCNPAGTLVTPNPKSDSLSDRSHFLKSKWLWAGLGIIAGGLYLKHQMDHQQKEPTTTYGY